MVGRNFLLLVTVAVVTATPLARAEDDLAISRRDAGRVLARGSAWGDYQVYAPKRGRPVEILVLVHGSLGQDESAMHAAATYITRWTDFAEQHRLLVLAPAFDRDRYQRAYGGYRGLFGRDVGADVFVNNLVDAYRKEMGDQDARVLLYGHSAGGQFVCRYCLTHPQRVRAAVLSAPGRYAFPTGDAPWPYGMGRFTRTLDWGDGNKQRVVVEPDRDKWLQATELPIAVIVGAEDTEPQPDRPGHRGRTRIELARNWVADMCALARSEDRRPGIRHAVIDGIGHDSRRLTPACQQALLDLR